MAECCRTLEQVAVTFLNSGLGLADAHEFEDGVEKRERELARSSVEWCFNALQSGTVEAMPQQIEQLGQKYRRLKKTHTQVLM